MEIIREAHEYINNDLTEKETAEKLGISRRTLQLHLKKLEEIDPVLYNLVLIKKSKNLKVGRVRGGKNGKATPSYTKEEAIKMANEIIENSYTYEEAANVYSIPKSTIYEMVHSDFIPEDVKMELDLVAIRNNKKKNAKRNII